ncbi:DUF692 domain-containing protein [Acidithiobacillus sp. AMEEHan]|uniref:DUF692 domain-containing protein n=1 Tax=Acidithiobacillus sp. AMEEHan TaxID=2994951 RepID=UPI0027E5BBC1|nr:DUF692 domain-containing protein [Acidithiobacillus sp. AMEEHan]
MRREFLSEFAQRCTSLPVDFVEIAPENWLDFSGPAARDLQQVLKHKPLFCHGLSLSIAGPEPINREFLLRLRDFLRAHGAVVYSEHLAYCQDAQGYLHDLLPIPFHEQSLRWTVERIQRVQDFLGQPLVLENTAFYGDFPESDRSELEFLLAVLQESGCELLLDLNNLFVNSQNHHYSASDFLAALPAERIRYYHVAGFYIHPAGWLIDTHDSGVSPEVTALLREAWQRFGARPTLLEWDNDIPPLETLLDELQRLRHGIADAA